jgi:peptide deformylase
MNIKSDSTAKEEEHAFINPVILQRKGGMEEKDEGCLSLPDIHGPVKRPKKIVLNAYTLAGEEVTWEMDGMYARVVQHECDHLDGVLFIDRLGPAGLLAVKEALQDLETAFGGERQRGLIPNDQLIAARLTELETARA